MYCGIFQTCKKRSSHVDFPRDLLIKPQKASAVREFAQEGCFRIKKPFEAQANGLSVLDLLQIQLFST
jgi:hypothetical protein